MDLNLKITADATEAKKALTDVEQNIQKVEAASKDTEQAIQDMADELKSAVQPAQKVADGFKGVVAAAKDVEQPIRNVVQVLTGQAGATDKVTAANTKLEQTTRALSGANAATAASVASATSNLTSQASAADTVSQGHTKAVNTTKNLTGAQVAVASTIAMSNKQLVEHHMGLMKAEQAAYAASLATAEATAKSSLFGTVIGGVTVGTLAWVAALAAVVVQGAALAGFLVRSARLYYETSEATRDSRDAVDELAKSWEALQFLIGASILGSEFSIVKPVKALEAAMMAVGMQIAFNIDLAKRFMAVLNPYQAAVTADIFSNLPDVTTTGSAAAGLTMWQNRVLRPDLFGGTTYQDMTGGVSGSEATRLFEASEKEADRLQKSLKNLEEAIRDVGGVTKLTGQSQKEFQDILEQVGRQYQDSALTFNNSRIGPLGVVEMLRMPSTGSMRWSDDDVFASDYAPLLPNISRKDPEEIAREIAALTSQINRERAKAEREADAWRRFIKDITGGSMVEDIRMWERAVKQVGGVTKLTRDAQDDLIKSVQATEAHYGSLERAGVGSMRRIFEETLRVISQLQVIDGFSNIANQLPGRIDPFQFFIPGTTIPNTIPVRNGLPVQATPTPFGPPINLLPGEQLPFNPYNLRFPTLPADDLANQLGGAQLPGQLPMPVPPGFTEPGFFSNLIGPELGTAIGQSVVQAIQGGGNIWQSVGSTIGLSIGSQIGKSLSKSVGGFLGDALGSLLPGIGALLGPLLEGIAGMFDDKGRDLVEDFAASFGGFDELHEELLQMGDAGEQLWIKLTQGVGRNNPEEAKRAIDEVTQAMRDYENGIAIFTQGAATRIQAFVKAFKDSGEDIKAIRDMIAAEAPEETMGADEAQARQQTSGFMNILGGGAEEIQQEFAQMGLYAGVAFAATLREHGWQKAIEDVGPMFDELLALQKEFGFEMEGSAAAFVGFYQTAKANEDVLTALDGLTQMIRGAGDALFLDQELMNAFGADAVTQFTRLTERGVDANQALIFMQPTLQALWEAQQKFGLETDKATQALIDQGVEQGIVGANMRDVNQKILDVLLAIGDVLGADIPDALRGLPTAAANAAAGIQDAFDGLNVQVPVSFDVEEPPDITRAGQGGIWNWREDGTSIEAPEEVPGIHEQRMQEGGVVLPFPGGTMPSYFDVGGRVINFVPKGTDTVPAMLTPGEGVVTVKGMQGLGADGLDAINKGADVAFLATGTDGPMAFAMGGIAQTDAVVQHFSRGVVQHFAEGGETWPMPASAVDYRDTDSLRRMNTLQLDRPLASPRSEPATMTVVFEEDGRRKAEYLIRHIPGAVRRIGKA